MPYNNKRYLQESKCYIRMCACTTVCVCLCVIAYEAAFACRKSRNHNRNSEKLKIEIELGIFWTNHYRCPVSIRVYILVCRHICFYNCICWILAARCVLIAVLMQLLFQFTAKINVVELRLPLRCTFTRSQAQFLFQWGRGQGWGCSPRVASSWIMQTGKLVSQLFWTCNCFASQMLFRLEIFISCACCRQLWRKLVRHAQHLNIAQL